MALEEPKFKQLERYLRPTLTIDCDNDAIRKKARSLAEAYEENADKAKSIFYFVRDEISYDPYSFLPLEASRILKRGAGYCVQKAILLVALARAIKIPARLGFADVRNHIMPEKLAEVAGMQGNNLFPYHGYAEFYVGGRWVKATPAFDLKMCQESRVIPVEFDGKNDAIFHSHNLDGQLHIEYVCFHGHYADVPVDKIVNATVRVYGVNVVERWKRGFLE